MIPSRLEFIRVMSGEYRADLSGTGSYHIDRVSHKTDCGDGWAVYYCPTFNVRIRVGYHRTLPDAKFAASAHALRAGLVVAQ